MKMYIFKILLFISPILIYVLLAVYIDPYNLMPSLPNFNNLDTLKKDIAIKINYPLFKLIEYEKNPTPIILLGDSRTNKLNSTYVSNLRGATTFNLAFGGATLEEIIQTFWEANQQKVLKEVYIGINFNLYNENNRRNRVREALKLKHSFIDYILSTYCLKSTYLILKSKLLHQKLKSRNPHFLKKHSGSIN